MKAATLPQQISDARLRRAVDSGIDAGTSSRVRRSKPGTVFTPTLFADLGGRAAVDKALQQLVAREELRRLSRGLYSRLRYRACWRPHALAPQS